MDGKPRRPRRRPLPPGGRIIPATRPQVMPDQAPAGQIVVARLVETPLQLWYLNIDAYVRATRS